MNFADLDLSKSYTYADYLKWRFNERLELIKGKVYKMSPAPSSAHQRIAATVTSELYFYLKGKPCQVFPAPFDVRLSRTINEQQIITVVQPDVCVICNPAKVRLILWWKFCRLVITIKNYKINMRYMKKPV
jgi:Uma2 family endonuclease